MPNSEIENESEDAFNSVNVSGTEKLLRWAKTEGIKIFIFISGTGVFKDSHNNFKENLSNRPHSNPYHRSKGKC